MSVCHWMLKQTKVKPKNGWVSHSAQEYTIYTEIIIERNP